MILSWFVEMNRSITFVFNLVQQRLKAWDRGGLSGAAGTFGQRVFYKDHTSNPVRARHQLKSGQVTTSNSCRTKLEQPVLVYCDSGGRRIRVIWRMLPLSTVPQWAGRMWSQPAPYREQRATASFDIVYHLCDHVIRMITTIHPKYRYEHAFMKTMFTYTLL